MSQKDKIPIFPSRANNVLIKNRLISARKGHSMLKKKRDALDMKLREIVAQRRTAVAECNERYKEAIFLIAKANFLATDLKPAPIIGSLRADAYMRLSSTKMIGLNLTTFEPVLRKPESLALTGLSKGGQHIEQIRESFQELFRFLVLISSYDYSIKIIKEALHTTNMRLNGLEFVIMPRLGNTTAYILNELDEMEREEFYRLKRSQKSRKKKTPQEKTLPGEPDDDEPEFLDISTNTDESMFETGKSTYTNSKMAQTIITGHFPSIDDVISPTDSLISGIEPIIGKRNQYILRKRTSKSLVYNNANANTSPESSSNPNRNNEPTSSNANESSSFKSVEDSEENE